MKYRLLGLIPANVHNSIQRNLDLAAQLQRDTDKRIQAIKDKQAAGASATPKWRETPPDADGMWLLRCMEDPTAGLVRVFTHDGNVMAECEIGTVGLMDLHNGLTDVRWERTSSKEARSAQQAHKQGFPKRSKREPTLEPTQKFNPISQSGHQGTGRESLSTALTGTKNDQ